MKNQWLARRMEFDWDMWLGDTIKEKFESLNNLVTRRRQQLDGYVIYMGWGIYQLYEWVYPTFLEATHNFEVFPDINLPYNGVQIVYSANAGIMLSDFKIRNFPTEWT